MATHIDSSEHDTSEGVTASSSENRRLRDPSLGNVGIDTILWGFFRSRKAWTKETLKLEDKESKAIKYIERHKDDMADDQRQEYHDIRTRYVFGRHPLDVLTLRTNLANVLTVPID